MAWRQPHQKPEHCSPVAQLRPDFCHLPAGDLDMFSVPVSWPQMGPCWSQCTSYVMKGEVINFAEVTARMHWLAKLRTPG